MTSLLCPGVLELHGLGAFPRFPYRTVIDGESPAPESMPQHISPLLVPMEGGKIVIPSPSSCYCLVSNLCYELYFLKT